MTRLEHTGRLANRNPHSVIERGTDQAAAREQDRDVDGDERRDEGHEQEAHDDVEREKQAGGGDAQDGMRGVVDAGTVIAGHELPSYRPIGFSLSVDSVKARAAASRCSGVDRAA
jgi:hypothetical protein